MTLKVECVNLVSLHGMQDASYQFIAYTFSEQHPKMSPTDQIIHTNQHSEQRERALYLPCSDRHIILTGNVMVTAVLGMLTNNFTMSRKNLAQQTEMGCTSAQHY
jgi:hypothetical protein